MQDEIGVLDSLIKGQQHARARQLAPVFAKKCGENCPEQFLVRKNYLIAEGLMRQGRRDSALQMAMSWLWRLDWGKQEEQLMYVALTTLKGQCLLRTGKLDEAAEEFSKFLNVTPEESEYHAIWRVGALANLATVDLMQQKMHQARTRLIEALRLTEQCEGRMSMRAASCLGNLGLIANVVGEPDKAEAYLKEAIAIKDSLSGGTHRSIGIFCGNLAIVLAEGEKYAEALHYIRRAYQIRIRTAGELHPQATMSAIVMGTVFADLAEPDSALFYLEKGKNAVQRLKTTNPIQATFVLQLMGQLYVALKDYDNAQVVLDEVVYRLGGEPSGEIDFSQISDLRHLHYNFLTRSLIYKGEMEEGVEIYADSLQWIYEKDLALYNYLHQQRGAARERQLITLLAFPLFENYLEFLSGRPNPSLEKAFELMELGKARMLSEKLQQAEISRFAGISDSLMAEEYRLDSTIVALEQALDVMRQRGAPATVMAELEEELNQWSAEEEAFLADLKLRHPAYYNAKYLQSPISLAEAQADLQPDEALVSYFIGNRNVYILLLRQGMGKLVRMKLDFPLRKWVGNFREAMYKHEEMASRDENVAAQHAEKYCRAAYDLYSKLLQPVAADLPLKVRIVPERSLAFLPFDALLSRMPERPEDFRTHPYLIHQHQFSYSISATLHHQQLQATHSPAVKEALVMAPSFSGLAGFKNLLHNGLEAQEIHAIIGGEVLLGAAATSLAFETKAHDFRILHIASHARSDDQNGDSSYIAFATADSLGHAPDVLYARDLYGIPLQAEMVVLSACETGLGEWRSGEGMIGLSRACMYAGAKSTMTSLWQVDDGRTSALIVEFYAGLRAGLSKDAALREAKLNYLATQSAAHPYYWAAFVPIGNMSPMTFKPSAKNVWLGFSFLLVLVIGVLLRKKMQKN